ncbi:MAG: NADP-dependent oxidoreductase [Actinobacteria bacterium]|nr:MAG: NADP-dependent oxidoreductase [Actinomycetota bacterium]
MRAIVVQDFGAPPLLTELPRPEPAPNEVLVHVLGSSVNALDLAIAAGMMREGIGYTLPLVLGRDFAGVVEGLGSQVTRFRYGDEAFGFIALPRLQGSWADFITLPQDAIVSTKPAGLDFVQAGALPLAGLTGMLGFEAVDPKPGDVVLIVGATGGVGSYATQLAKAHGVTVIATAKPEEEGYVRGQGAAETVDYSTRDVAAAVRERHPGGIQGLIDLVNRTPEGFAKLAELVADGGGVASSLGAANVEELAKRNVRASNLASSAADAEVLHRLAIHVEEGHVTPPIGRVYPLRDAPQGMDDFRKGTLGKLALALG